MNDAQVAYALILAALAIPSWGGQRYAWAWLACNLLATLAVCLAMDMGAIDRTGATVSMLIIDLCAGVGLALRPGVPSLIALGYAITAPIYFVNLVWGVQIGATFAIIYPVAFAQLGVLGLGSGMGNNSGGGGRRFPAFRAIMALPQRDNQANQVLACESGSGRLSAAVTNE